MLLISFALLAPILYVAVKIIFSCVTVSYYELWKGIASNEICSVI